MNARKPSYLTWEQLYRENDLEKDSPAAVGGILSAETLAAAYQWGFFPWPPGDPDIYVELEDRYGHLVESGMIKRLDMDQKRMRLPWWNPDPRSVIFQHTLHISRSLRKRIRQSKWTTTLDEAFDEVVDLCRRGNPLSWITPEMGAAYRELQVRGRAHSIEVWEGNKLVGGMYGVVTGAVFTGESMFSLRTDASKVAMVDFGERFFSQGGMLIDTQMPNEHLCSMGAVNISRQHFVKRLEDSRTTMVTLDASRLPVNRLATYLMNPERAEDSPIGQRD
ncbi:leucyl/phenylalanyl-tRNA--protein transferase [Sulfobacillus sp. DSM 109850]|uniref:Leucyl/phenylalanyl-tRNA--protein transferase n=2 Tax=Sulfobacillus harzensis TaxID=2729629 RepID=A0A7Y0L4N1_9FIRM|nr:leucyl/phenylalanyl-tRNA--protein transferase [Sulfobacillus harzensis]